MRGQSENSYEFISRTLERKVLDYCKKNDIAKAKKINFYFLGGPSRGDIGIKYDTLIKWNWNVNIINNINKEQVEILLSNSCKESVVLSQNPWDILLDSILFHRIIFFYRQLDEECVTSLQNILNGAHDPFIIFVRTQPRTEEGILMTAEASKTKDMEEFKEYERQWTGCVFYAIDASCDDALREFIRTLFSFEC